MVLSYWILMIINPVLNIFSANVTQNHVDANTWNARLGHIGQERIYRLAKYNLLGPLTIIVMPTYEHCLAGKMTRKSFGKGTRANVPLWLIHYGICGPMNVRARHGVHYFIIFIDDYMWFNHVYLISHKSEAPECFKCYVSLVENQSERTIKVLRTYHRRKYLSEQFKMFCDEKGIDHQLTILGTPE